MKQRIIEALRSLGEATAKKIAFHIGESDAQSSVNAALNTLRTEATVECEKRAGKGNELIYWLSAPVNQNSGEIQAIRGQLASADRQIKSQKERIVELEADLQRHSAGLMDASTNIIRFLLATQQMTGSEHKPSNLVAAEQMIATTLKMMQGRVEELEQTIHEMELAGVQGADAVDVKDAAVGYIVRVVGKKPRICTKPNNAHEAAMAAARAHGRADVFALVPVGKAVRGAEWKEAA